MSDNTKATTNLNFATANDLANMLNANYRTVSKILLEMSENKEVESTKIKKNNREVVAYLYNNDTIKAVQGRLRQIRKGKKTIVQRHNTITNTNASNLNIATNTVASDANEANLTIFNITKQNNELENQIKALEFEKKDLQMEKTKIESDLYKLQSDYKLIEMKQQTFESENGRLNQNVADLQLQISKKDKIILFLTSIIVIALTVVLTIIGMRMFTH